VLRVRVAGFNALNCPFNFGAHYAAFLSANTDTSETGNQTTANPSQEPQKNGAPFW